MITLNNFDIKILYFIDSKLNEAYSCYLINERINDWYELDKSLYTTFKNDLGYITNSLREGLLLTLSKIFDDRNSGSICIQNICNIILSTKIVDDKSLHIKMKCLAKDIIDEIQINQVYLQDLSNWRDKALAHYDKSLKTTKIVISNIDKLISLLIFTQQKINSILNLLGRESIEFTYRTFRNSIDNLFVSYNIGNKLQETANCEQFKELWLNVNIPK